MMTSDNEMDTHPLDRDYSQPVRTRAATPTIEYYPRLRRFGLYTFAAGFATVLLAAIVQGNSGRGVVTQPAGYSMHHLAMVIILAGGVLIILAYRLPHLKVTPRRKNRTRPWRDQERFFLLVMGNALAFLAILLVVHWCRFIASQTLVMLIYNVMTIACALLVTIAVWHEGMIRAYAIGVLVALMLNNFMSYISLAGGYFRLGLDDLSPLVANLVTIQLSGLTCAGYVCLVKPRGGQGGASASEKSQP